METAARNATLEDLAVLLKEQHGRKLDVVASATAINASGGALVLAGTEAVITEDGVTPADGRYVPTDVCEGGIAEKLKIPRDYLRRMRGEATDLWDLNVNGWLHGAGTDGEPGFRPADHRKFMVRAFRGDDGGNGIARAFVSDSYGAIDHLDALTAALDGVQQAGVPVVIDGCDLSDRRMYVRIVSEAVTALAPALLAGYRSPHTGDEGNANPTVFAGFVISNSETGHGAFTITPRLVVQVCRNGMTMTRDALSRNHIGQRLGEGIVRWSQDTLQKNLELITAQARDSVATFLDVSYMNGKLRELEVKAGARVSEPEKVLTEVGKQLHFSEAQTSAVLSAFIGGGQLTAGGVMQAVTAAAQTHEDADTAYEMEASGLRAMEIAAALAR